MNLTNIKIENILSAELIRINKNNQELYSFNLIDNSTNNFYHRDHVTINLRDSFFSTQVVIVKGEINLPGKDLKNLKSMLMKTLLNKKLKIEIKLEKREIINWRIP